MDQLSQNPQCSTEESTEGFDLAAGIKWIYPENYPLREYQFQIVNTCLFHNTLVCLPTGLGKTFIAAVVMYNYWRWYPRGIIVFLAPTRPLVAQQINACHDIMGIPISETIELTGQTSQAKRQAFWRKKRVIFATPQTFQKDLAENIVPTKYLKCVVVDEAHRALGKHACCESIRLLNEKNQFYRLLGLSATPGGKIEDVVQIINNLGISKLELRDDKSLDIRPFINERTQEIISVGLGDDLSAYHERYMAIVDPRLRVLINNKLISPGARRVSKGYIHNIIDRLKTRPDRPANYNSLTKVLYELLTMCHAGDLMLNHGLRAFHAFYELHRNDKDKTWIQREPDLLQLLDDVQEFLGPFPDPNLIETGTLNMVPDNIMFGHAKFAKLRDIIENHFIQAQSNGTDTRVIVFVEYRNSAYEVYVLLLKLQPLIRPQMFMGQAGQSRKLQIEALDNFRRNKVNVLISTSVGEEGLDIGEVDLIVCFDILNKSPTRLVQRMGRTGRKRNGHIIILVTDGTEHHTLKNALCRRDSLNTKVRQSVAVQSALLANSPRMVPAELNPECKKMQITVLPITPKAQKLRNKSTKSKSTAGGSKSTKNGAAKSTTAGQKDNKVINFLNPLTHHEEPVDNDPEMVQMKVQEIRKPGLFAQLNKNNTNKIKHSDVKLLTCDDAAIEFLTLLTIEQSMKDVATDNNSFTVSCARQTITEDANELLSREIPPYTALDIIASLEPYVEPAPDVDEASLEFSDYGPEPWDNAVPAMDCSPEPILSSQPARHTAGRFEDLCDESDSEVIMSSPVSQKNCQVDWAVKQESDSPVLNASNNIKSQVAPENPRVSGFEDILDEMSDEELFNLDRMSDDSVTEIALDLSKSTSDSSERRKSSKLVCSTPIHGGKCANRGKTVESPEKNGHQGALTRLNGYDIANSTFNDLDSTFFDCDLNTRALDQSVKVVNHQRNEAAICHNNSQPLVHAGNVNNQLNAINQVNDDQLTPDSTTSDWPRMASASPGKSNKNDDFEEDFFGTESMMIDAALLEQIAALENSKNVPKISVNLPPKESNISTLELSHKKQNTNRSQWKNKSIISSTPCHSKNSINNEISELKMCHVEPEKTSNSQWPEIDDEEFDFSPDAIVESKYFSKSSNSSTSINSSARKSLNFNEKHSVSSIKEKKIISPKIELRATENLPSTSKNIHNVRKSVFSKFQTKRYNNDDSDDDFAQTKIIKPTFRRSENISDSEEQFCDVLRHKENGLAIPRGREFTKLPEKSRKPGVVISSTKVPSKSRTPAQRLSKFSPPRSSSLDTYSRRKHRSRRKNHRDEKGFLLDEAEVSSDENISPGSSEADDDDDDDEDDKDLEGFVSHSQHPDTSVDMKAHYLRSIRSPRQPGKFLIRKPKSPPANLEIYSQAVGNETNTYLCDSFCVESGVEENTSDDCTILEDIERELTRKRKRKNSEDVSSDKRRRIVQISDSSEDETEKLRAQIAEQSFKLKEL